MTKSTESSARINLLSAFTISFVANDDGIVIVVIVAIILAVALYVHNIIASAALQTLWKLKPKADIIKLSISQDEWVQLCTKSRQQTVERENGEKNYKENNMRAPSIHAAWQR